MIPDLTAALAAEHTGRLLAEAQAYRRAGEARVRRRERQLRWRRRGAATAATSAA